MRASSVAWSVSICSASVGQVRLDVGLDDRVLVLGVRHEQVDDAVDVRRPGPTRAPRSDGIEPAGRARDGEQLGADALVDVAVEVDGHGGERCEKWCGRSRSWCCLPGSGGPFELAGVVETIVQEPAAPPLLKDP